MRLNVCGLCGLADICESFIHENLDINGYIYIYHHNHHHHHTVQVAQCQDHLGHKYRSGMQQPNADSTRARSALRWCPCASCIWLLHPAPILVPKMVLTLRNLRWWCFSFHQLAKILHLPSRSSSPAATCAGGAFHWSTSAFTNLFLFIKLHYIIYNKIIIIKITFYI